ncbi:DUF1642 domain-containing protein [Streptococcus sp. TATVAM-FAB35]|uniref:DUF1642 domain-containing protein n=1 Tax=Streptococcus TaxID=1301 RepID=UPI00397EE5D1
MNKQEVIEKIEASKYSEFIYDFDGWKEEKKFNSGLDCALSYVNQLDEPEKPEVPQYVADMIIKRKAAGQSVIKAIENLRFYEDACKWVRNNGETFVKAWLYGYEVEKEKLYRARHKLTGEYLSQNYAKTGYYHSLDHFHILKLSKKDWEDLGVLDDKMYEIEETEEVNNNDD